MFLSGGLLDYSNRSTSATRTINSKIRPGDVEVNKIFSFSVNSFEVTSYTPVCLGGTLEALLHRPEPQQKRFDFFFPITGGCSEGLGAF